MTQACVIIIIIIYLIDNKMAGVSDSPERLANPERESPVEGETLPKMRTFLGKVKGMTTTACIKKNFKYAKLK